MKRILLIALAMISISASAQRISRDEFDRFTKNRVIETSYTTMYKKMTLISTEHGINLALRKYGESYVLLADIKNINPIKFVEGNGIIFLLDNDSTIELKGNYKGIATKSEIGSAVNAYSFTTSFDLNRDEVNTLRTHKIVGIRTSYAAGIFDGNIKKQNQSNLQLLFKMIDDREKKDK
jgi:hypothetical protein